MDSVTVNEFHDKTVSSEYNKIMDKYRVPDEQWVLIEDRMNNSSQNSPDRSNSKLSQYRVSGEQWRNVELSLKKNGIDPGLPPKPTASIKTISRQISIDSGYAMLDHMKSKPEKIQLKDSSGTVDEVSPHDTRQGSRRHSHDSGKLLTGTPDYEKQKKSPHPHRKESSLQQKIQQRKELSQSIQSLSPEAVQDLDPLTIPKDGDLQKFSVEEISTFLRYMRIDEYIVQRLQRKKLDGVKFSKLKDTDLENIGIKNPIIIHFRDRSSCKKRISFML